MNREKTMIFTAGLTPLDVAATEHYRFSSGTLPTRYLGLPLMHRILRKSDYSPLVDRVAARFNHWANKILTFAGRVQLISSVICSLLNFWCAAFILPKGCISSLEKLCNRFLWTGGTTKKGGIKVSWTHVCQPKQEAGLGLRNFRLWNKCLIMKLIWTIFTKNSLWGRWITDHNLKHISLWNIEPSNSTSWIWKSILALRPLAKDLLRCQVGDGRTLSYWFDNWAPIGPLITITGPAGPALMGLPATSTVSMAADSNGWLLPSARSRNPLLSELRSVLLSIDPPLISRGPDRFFWVTDNTLTPYFSSRRTWEALRTQSTIKTWAPVVWFRGHIPKHAFTFWVAVLDRLPVRSRLAMWGIATTDSCCLCNSFGETRDHLFLHCPFSSQVWQMVLAKLGQSNSMFADWSVMLTWMATTSTNLRQTLKRIVTQATIYLLWMERNARLHNNASSSAPALFSRLDRLVRDTLLARIPRRKFRSLLSDWFRFD